MSEIPPDLRRLLLEWRDHCSGKTIEELNAWIATHLQPSLQEQIQALLPDGFRVSVLERCLTIKWEGTAISWPVYKTGHTAEEIVAAWRVMSGVEE